MVPEGSTLRVSTTSPLASTSSKVLVTTYLAFSVPLTPVKTTSVSGGSGATKTIGFTLSFHFRYDSVTTLRGLNIKDRSHGCNRESTISGNFAISIDGTKLIQKEEAAWGLHPYLHRHTRWCPRDLH